MTEVEAVLEAKLLQLGKAQNTGRTPKSLGETKRKGKREDDPPPLHKAVEKPHKEVAAPNLGFESSLFRNKRVFYYL